MNVRLGIPAFALACIAAASACASTPATGAASAATEPGCPAAMAAEYQLDGVMETGSGLLLREDCSFEWYFSYGALDLAARGKWQAESDGVALRVEDMAVPPQLSEYRFERMRLRRDGEALVPAWPWDMDAFARGVERGRYERVQP